MKRVYWKRDADSFHRVNKFELPDDYYRTVFLWQVYKYKYKYLCYFVSTEMMTTRKMAMLGHQVCVETITMRLLKYTRFCTSHSLRMK